MKEKTYRVYRISKRGYEILIGEKWSLADAEMVKSVNESEYPQYKGKVFVALDR